MTDHTPGLALLQLRAHRLVDAVAGEARRRYITDVPGQQAVYVRKLEQAQQYLVAYALDAQASAPPYIAAEAAALGVSAFHLATQVMSIAEFWDDTLSPAIEAARISGKAAVSAAESPEAVESARDAAIAALNAI